MSTLTELTFEDANFEYDFACSALATIIDVDSVLSTLAIPNQTGTRTIEVAYTPATSSNTGSIEIQDQSD